MHLRKHRKLWIFLRQVNSCQCDKVSHPLRGCDVKSHYVTKYYEARFARYFISLFTCDNMSHVLCQITLYYEILQYNHRLCNSSELARRPPPREEIEVPTRISNAMKQRTPLHLFLKGVPNFFPLYLDLES